MGKRGSFACAILFLAASCFADTTTLTLPALHMKQYGFIALDGGEIIHGVTDQIHGTAGSDITKSWMEDMLFQYVNECTFTDRIWTVLSIECQMSYSYPYNQNASWLTKQPSFTFFPDQAEAMYTIGAREKPLFEFGFGYFPFKTNPDSKDLGDYLFRTGTYPVYTVTTFERSYARVLGMRATANLLQGLPLDQGLRLDLLLTSSTLLPPLVDGSLTGIVTYSLDKVLELGAGVSFAHLLPVDNDLTTPQNAATEYAKSINKNGDTSYAYYTFAATKPMARFSFDPKPLVSDNIIPHTLFGKDDFRLYGEACITGWQDYVNLDTAAAKVFSYANRNDRTLIMGGFNIPAFKILDVLSVEVEHYPNRYPNDAYYMLGQTNQPLPEPLLFPYAPGLTKVYPWFWSVYAKKSFLGRFSLIAQVARDHMRPINNDPNYQYTGDVFERKGDFWISSRLKADF